MILQNDWMHASTVSKKKTAELEYLAVYGRASMGS